MTSTLGYFHITGTLTTSLNCVLKFLRDSTGKRGGNIHKENSPLFPPGVPQGNQEEILAGMIPWNSPINLRGNLGNVDGSPAGLPDRAQIGIF